MTDSVTSSNHPTPPPYTTHDDESEYEFIDGRMTRTRTPSIASLNSTASSSSSSFYVAPNAAFTSDANLLKATGASLPARTNGAPRSIPRDVAAASSVLFNSGALKSYKPDGVLRANTNQALQALSIGALEVLLQRHRASLSNTRLLASLPDGGKLLHAKCDEIERVLKEKKQREKDELDNVAMMMEKVKIEGKESENDDGSEMKHDDDTHSSKEFKTNHPLHPFSSSSSSFGSPPLARGRGSAALAATCSSDQMNTRIATDRSKHIESPLFRRPPPTVISVEEATRLMRIKDTEWHANMMQDARFNDDASSQQVPGIRDENYRDTTHYDDEDESTIATDDYDAILDDATAHESDIEGEDVCESEHGSQAAVE